MGLGVVGGSWSRAEARWGVSKFVSAAVVESGLNEKAFSGDESCSLIFVLDAHSALTLSALARFLDSLSPPGIFRSPRIPDREPLAVLSRAGERTFSFLRA